MSGMMIALVGNPNCGKTALFNQLTGARQKVANFAGVTVERKEGAFTAPSGRTIKVLDLPGAYSLDALGPDEVITRDVCLGKVAEVGSPDVIVCVADATNLRLHLRFVLEIRQLGRPMVLALNMMDAANKRGIHIDQAELQARLGIPVIQTVAIAGGGAKHLIDFIDTQTIEAPKAPEVEKDVHLQVRDILSAAVTMPRFTSKIDDQLDAVLLNPWLGIPILFAIMFVMFQAVFAWAGPLMDGIEGLFGWAAEMVSAYMPEGLLQSFIADALISGIGSVLVFLPQIIILFAFILILEESGYLPRAAFLLDTLMGTAGLTGRAFIPLLSSFACAIPGVMATRSIHDIRDRLTTIMIAPLMTCSARWPVYILLVGAFIPERQVWGFASFRGLVLLGLVFAGIFSAMLVSWVMKLIRRDKSASMLLMELPSYRLPNPRNLALGLWERAGIFMRRITGVIFAANTLIWVLATFPKPPANATLPDIDYSFAGMIGHAMEPIFRPIGFGWEICIALIPGMAAREVAVSALGTVYAIGGSEEAVANQLSTVIASQWSLATAFSLLAWYIFAPQCLSTLAVIKRETNSWRFTALTTIYLFALAYLASFITYTVTKGITG
ncbi:MAG: ferrous iron transporter B [Asticcacaulis sp.]